MRLLSLLCCFALPAFAGTVISPSIAPPNVEESSGAPLLSNTALGRTLESIQEAKEELGLPLTLSAWHWWHIAVDNGPGGTGYGFTGLPGTYYYNAVFDPELALELGPINKAGLYLDSRIRDGGKFRRFLDDQWWFWESYAWVETDFGKHSRGDAGYVRLTVRAEEVRDEAAFQPMRLDPEIERRLEGVLSGLVPAAAGPQGGPPDAPNPSAG